METFGPRPDFRKLCTQKRNLSSDVNTKAYSSSTNLRRRLLDRIADGNGKRLKIDLLTG